MWLENVKRRVKARHLDVLADRLDAAGMMKEFYITIRKARSIVTIPYQNDFLAIIQILTDEIWKANKQVHSTQADEQSKPENLSTNKTLEKSSISTTKNNFKKSFPSIDLPSPSSIRNFTFIENTLNRSGSESFLSSPKYKNPISQEIAYMVKNKQSTFSFPKGSATFTRTKRLISNIIPSNTGPGPGSYFCDPRTTRNLPYSSLRTSIPSCRSSKNLSLSLIKF